MLKRYSIWDKKSDVITPSYQVFTAEQWKERYPAAKLLSMVIVGSAGDINGGFFGVLSQMVSVYEQRGCVFTEGMTDVEKLEAIERFEDDEAKKAKEASSEPKADERIAAALEYQNLMAMPDAQ